MIVDYIDDHRDRFGVHRICSVLTEHGLPIAPSTYYAAKARGPVSDAWTEAHTANTVRRLYPDNRRLYEVRKMWHTMEHAGHDVLIACTDGLTGFSEAIEATWPQATVKTCVVHLIRSSMRFVSYGDHKEGAAALKVIYTAPTADAAAQAFEEFVNPH